MTAFVGYVEHPPVLTLLSSAGEAHFLYNHQEFRFLGDYAVFEALSRSISDPWKLFSNIRDRAAAMERRTLL